MRANKLEMPANPLTSYDTVFVFIFGIIFEFYYRFLLISMIVYNYMLLREKLQSITEALAEMTADKSKEVSKKWFPIYIYIKYV